MVSSHKVFSTSIRSTFFFNSTVESTQIEIRLLFFIIIVYERDPAKFNVIVIVMSL